jgi:hypothetical protein
VTQHVTIRHHSPTVRQRAEVSALRDATLTIRRINSKAREFKRALRALRQAKAGIQTQIHNHHVLRAAQAKKTAARATRRAAWSQLLQHRLLRKQLFKKLAKMLRKDRLTPEGRKQAIAALIKNEISPAERSRLHAFVNGAGRKTRANRRYSRRRRALTRRARNRRNRRSRRRRSSKYARRRRALNAKKPAAPTTPTPAPAAKPAAPAAATTTTPAAAAPAVAGWVSKKDQKAIDALMARVRAAATTTAAPAAKAPSTITPIQSKPSTLPAVGSTANRSARSRLRFAAIEQAEAAAVEAENEAVATLNAEMDGEAEQDTEDVVMKTEAQVRAETEDTEEFLKHHGF